MNAKYVQKILLGRGERIVKTLSVVLLVTIGSFSAIRSSAGGIHDAAERCDLDAVRKLVENSPSLINARDDKGSTPLHVAVANGRGPVIRYLVEAGTDLNATNAEGKTVLHVLASQTGGSPEERIELCLRKGANPNLKDKEGKSPYNYAVSDIMRGLLLKNGAQIGEAKLVALLLDEGNNYMQSIAFEPLCRIGRPLPATIQILASALGKDNKPRNAPQWRGSDLRIAIMQVLTVFGTNAVAATAAVERYKSCDIFDVALMARICLRSINPPKGNICAEDTVEVTGAAMHVVYGSFSGEPGKPVPPRAAPETRVYFWGQDDIYQTVAGKDGRYSVRVPPGKYRIGWSTDKGELLSFGRPFSCRYAHENLGSGMVPEVEIGKGKNQTINIPATEMFVN